MEIGVDSFAAATLDQGSLLPKNAALAIEELLDRIKFADEVGLNVFGIGEHYRQEFLDSAPTLLLAAAAACSHPPCGVRSATGRRSRRQSTARRPAETTHRMNISPLSTASFGLALT